MSDLDRDQFRNSLQAEARLAALDALEEEARWYDTERCTYLRRGFASAYRQAIGVVPEQRMEFRRMLEQLTETGALSIAELEESIARRHQSPKNGDGGASGNGWGGDEL